MDYRTLYDEFISSYSAGTTNAEQVGLAIAKMAQFYCDANMAMGTADQAFNRKFAEIMQLEEGGKGISAAKAKVMVDASAEAISLSTTKIRLENIEQLINALKYLQRGLQQEFSNS